MDETCETCRYCCWFNDGENEPTLRACKVQLDGEIDSLETDENGSIKILTNCEYYEWFDSGLKQTCFNCREHEEDYDGSHICVLEIDADDPHFPDCTSWIQVPDEPMEV